MYLFLYNKFGILNLNGFLISGVIAVQNVTKKCHFFGDYCTSKHCTSLVPHQLFQTKPKSELFKFGAVPLGVGPLAPLPVRAMEWE